MAGLSETEETEMVNHQLKIGKQEAKTTGIKRQELACNQRNEIVGQRGGQATSRAEGAERPITVKPTTRFRPSCACQEPESGTRAIFVRIRRGSPVANRAPGSREAEMKSASRFPTDRYSQQRGGIRRTLWEMDEFQEKATMTTSSMARREATVGPW